MNTYTIEFTIFVVEANSKEEARDMIKKYIMKQSKDLNGFLNSDRVKIIEKEVLRGKDDPWLTGKNGEVGVVKL